MGVSEIFLGVAKNVNIWIILRKYVDLNFSILINAKKTVTLQKNGHR